MDFFGQVPVSNEQAAVIARGLYSLAKVDGHEEREGMLIQSLWMDAMGWDRPLPKDATDITADELASGLPTKELKQLFLKTAILLAYADSAVSDKERAWIESTGKAFGFDAKEIGRLDELVRTFLLSQLAHLQNVDATKEIAKKLGF